MDEKEKGKALLESLRLNPYKGSGDYTRDRHRWLDQITLEEIFQAMRKAEKTDTTQYDEIC